METDATKTSLVRVKEIQGRGRGLVAIQPIKAGQVLLQETPLLIYPHSNPCITTSFCAHCFTALRPSPSFLTCPSCTHPLFFCSAQCQSGAQSSSHTQWVCKSLNILSSSSLDFETHTQACFLIAAYNTAIVSPAKFQLLSLLQGNNATVDSQAHLLHSFMVNVISFWPLQGQLPGFSPELTASLLSKDKQNAFGLMAPVQQGGERQVRAYAIYAQASFFNHDCLPNACRSV